MRGVIGGAIAGALVLLSAGESGAKRKKKCKKTQKKCGKKCIPKAACCGGCSDGTCCNGACVDLATDTANCGVCGLACPDAEESCIHGVCTCEGLPDCPVSLGCTCGSRLGGGSACFGDITFQVCFAEAECPIGQACLANNKCATGCPF